MGRKIYRSLVFFLPLLYSIQTRFLKRSKLGLIVWATEYLIPVLLAMVILNVLNFYLLRAFLSIVAVYNLYEIGYIQNDCETIKREQPRTKRLSEEALLFYEKRKVGIYAFRLLTGLYFTWYFVRAGISAAGVAAMWAVIPYYIMYNLLRGRINQYLILFLTGYRYCFPLYLYGCTLSNEATSLIICLIFAYPIPTFIEICSHGKGFGPEKWSLLFLKHYDERFLFRIKYYAAMTMLTLTLAYENCIPLIYSTIPLYYLLDRLPQLKMKKIGGGLGGGKILESEYHGFKKIAIYVIYNPDIDKLRKSVGITGEIFDEIWITDNSPEVHLLDGAKVIYSHQPENNGIARGQNLGIRYAIDKGYDWIAFFDQDSIYDGHFLLRLIASFQKILQYDSHAYGIAPMAVNMDSGVVLNKKSMQETVCVNSREYITVRELMCSASVIRTQLFKEVGLMDESLFIDGVDFEICWRGAYKIGAHFYLTKECVLEHQLGEGDRKILGRNCHIPTPFRSYYQVRNGMVLSKRKYVPLKWKITENAKSLGKLLLFPIFLSPHGQYLKSITRGYYDGLIKKASS